MTATISWLLCFVLLAGPTLGLEALAGVPRSASMLLIWITLAGVPRVARDTGSDERPVQMAGLSTRVGLSVALMGPLLCLAGALDRAAGFPAAGLYLTLFCGALLAVTLQVAAQRSSRSGQGALRYAWGWLSCVLLAPVLQAVAGWDGSAGGAVEGLAVYAALSPLEWAHGRAMAMDFQWPILPAALAVGLVLLASPPVQLIDEDSEEGGEASGEENAASPEAGSEPSEEEEVSE
ncbi:MAG TPA: hypothetical protein EYF98_13840 [Planctomycetes bacterium]|nr:hypothetical protein [Planctomycetota bacterium]